jgi:DNA-binding response OmpR family regulator
VGHARITELEGIRVLLVTDDEHTLHLVRGVLDLAGAHVVAITSTDAIRATVTADVIVCDLTSPRVAGCQFLSELQRGLAHAGGAVPAIALTVAGTRNAPVWSPGFQRYLTKPVDGRELRGAILELVRR